MRSRSFNSRSNTALLVLYCVYYRDITEAVTSDTLNQSNGEQVLHLRSLVGELQREVVDLKGARNSAEQKLDNILLSLPKQLSSTYSM